MRETLCWTCRRPGTGSCSWDLDFTPVEGWTATRTSLSSTPAGCRLDSYCVHFCPLFLPEEYRLDALRPGYGALLSDERLEQYIFKGFSDLEISQRCGMTVNSVRRRRRQFMLQQLEMEDDEE